MRHRGDYTFPDASPLEERSMFAERTKSVLNMGGFMGDMKGHCNRSFQNNTKYFTLYDSF